MNRSFQTFDVRKLEDVIYVGTGLAAGQSAGQAYIGVDHQKEKKSKENGQDNFGEQALTEQNGITQFLEPKPVHPQNDERTEETERK